MRDWNCAWARNGKMAGVLTGVIAAGVVGIVARVTAAPAKPSARDVVVGYVDLGQVTEQIKQTPDWKVMVQKFEDMKGRYADEIQNLTKIRYLDKSERLELDTLRAKAKPGESEKLRIEQLEKKSDQLDAEYTSLAGVEKPTDEQRKKVDDLYRLRQNAISDLQMETNKRRTELQKTEGEVLDGMQEKILKYVAQVAEGKGLVMVVDRQAILYGGLDMTPDVLKKLK